MTMNRRDFLRMGGFLTVSTATVGLTGCFHDEDDETAGISTPEATGSNWQFPQSVVSADPKPDSIVLWTRVTPSGNAYVTGNTSANLSVRLVVSTDAANSGLLGQVGALLQGTQVASTLIPAYAKYDGSVRHKLTGLTANTVYYYQFVAGAVRTKIGRFKTAPAAAVTPSQLKFAFMSCQDWNSNHWGAFDQIVIDDLLDPTNAIQKDSKIGAKTTPSLDFVVHLGDYIYETTEYSSGSVESKHGAQALPNGNTLNGITHAATLDDYRYLYKTYRSDVRIQAFHERFPIIATWDDHEFSDDSYGNAETYTNANTKQSGRRQAANQAWFEFMPADIPALSSDLSTFQTVKLYRDLKFGTLMHLVMTDERLYRSDHLIPENTDINPDPNIVTELGRINSRYLAPEASMKGVEATKSGLGAGIGDNLSLISVLGQTQRDWWKNTMSGSTATWKLWGNEVSLLRMGVNGVNAIATLLSLGATLQGNWTASDTSIPNRIKSSAPLFSALATALGNAALATPAAAGAVAAGFAGASSNAADAVLHNYPALGPAANQTLTPVGHVGVTLLLNQAADEVTKYTAVSTILASVQPTLPAANRSAAAAAATAAFNTAKASDTAPAQAGALSYAVIAGANLLLSSVAAGAIAAAGAGATDAQKVDAALTATAALATGLGIANDYTAARASIAVTGYNVAAAADPKLVAPISAAVAAGFTTAQATSIGGAAALTPGDDATKVAAAKSAILAINPALADAQATAIATAVVNEFNYAWLLPASQVIAFGLIRPSVQTSKAASPFFTGAVASGAITASAAAFLQKFLYNADQWDGYRAERKNLMDHLRDTGIQNVVALTGDIHAFFAGKVYDEFAGEVLTIDGSGNELTASAGGNPVMVDLVTAGISSSSWFSYLKDVVSSSSSLSALGNLIYYTLPKAKTTLPMNVVLPVLEFSLGKPFSMTGLSTMISDALKKGVALEGNPDKATTGIPGAPWDAFVAGLAAKGLTFNGVTQTIAANTQLHGLCNALAAMNANSWLQHIDSDSQGYAVVTLTSTTLDCKFHHLNHMLDLGTSALGRVAPGVFQGSGPILPDTRPTISRTTTVAVDNTVPITNSNYLTVL